MNNRASSLRFRLIMFIITALAIAFAFVHSLMPADISSQESGGITELIYRFFSLFGISAQLSETLIRKAAHFTEFAVIGGCALCCAYSFDRFRPYKYAPQVLFTGLITAVADETIQLFTDGRAGLVADVWIDFAGVFTGSAVMTLILGLHIRKKIRKESL